MKSVKVFIYSYKNKNLLEQVKDIIARSGNNVSITYYVYDQNNVDRSFHFKDVSSVVYKFVQWDDYKSITHYRNSTILNGNTADYFLEINPNIVIMNDWYEYLTSVLFDKSVISGQGKTILLIKNGKLVRDFSVSEKIEESNYLDINFMFLKLKDTLTLLQLSMLKDQGQDLLGTLILLEKEYKIYSLPTGSYLQQEQLNSETYVPYSKVHGYNKMLNFILKFSNKKFEDFYGIKINNISKLKYEINDVEYHSYKISLENLDQPRFLNGYDRVQIL